MIATVDPKDASLRVLFNHGFGDLGICASSTKCVSTFWCVDTTVTSFKCVSFHEMVNVLEYWSTIPNNTMVPVLFVPGIQYEYGVQVGSL